VRQKSLELGVRQEATLIPKGDALPARGFTDDDAIGMAAREEVARASRCGSLLFHSAAHHDAPALTWSGCRCGGGEGGQGALRVHSAAAKEFAFPLRHPDLAGHGVDVAEQQKLAPFAIGRWRAFEHAQRVACPVEVGYKAAFA
jgi:hypothetical protein